MSNIYKKFYEEILKEIGYDDTAFRHHSLSNSKARNEINRVIRLKVRDLRNAYDKGIIKAEEFKEALEDENNYFYDYICGDKKENPRSEINALSRPDQITKIQKIPSGDIGNDFYPIVRDMITVFLWEIKDSSLINDQTIIDHTDLSNDIVNQGKLVDTYKNEINIPSTSKSKWYKRWMWIFGFRNWVYKFPFDSSIPENKRELPPLGLEERILKELTENYISSDYIQNEIIYDEKTHRRESDILRFLYKHTIQKPNKNSFKYFFVLASSGIGKTTLLLRLFLKTKGKYNGDKTIYILSFAQRHLVYDFELAKKQNGILLLDAIDEDFSLSKKEDINTDEFREKTRDFNKVVITSRNEFFKNKESISSFINSTSALEHSDYKIISLCPFDENQIKIYLKKKFPIRKERKKAIKIRKYIGNDTLHRQLLISKIDKLFGFLEEKGHLQDVKTYQMFEYMLKNTWLKKERNKAIKITGSEFDLNVIAYEKTMDFCRILAKGFLELKQGDYFGFKFDELTEKFEDLKLIEKSKLLTNRTFLILDTTGRYRFAHSSIFDFFLAQVALKDGEKFNKRYFQNYIKEDQNKFAKTIYEEGIMLKINKVIDELTENNLEFDVQITANSKDVIEYTNEMCFEPYFITINNCEQAYEKKEWESINILKNKLSDYNSVIGLKFISSEDGINWQNENIDEKKIRLQRRKECFKITKPIFNYFNNLKCLDLSEMGLNNYDVKGIRFDNMEILNFRENNFIHLSFTLMIERLFLANFINSSLNYHPITAENLIIQHFSNLNTLIEEKSISINNGLSLFLDENKVNPEEFKANGNQSSAFEGFGDILELGMDLDFSIIIFSQSKLTRLS